MKSSIKRVKSTHSQAHTTGFLMIDAAGSKDPITTDKKHLRRGRDKAFIIF